MQWIRQLDNSLSCLFGEELYSVSLWPLIHKNLSSRHLQNYIWPHLKYVFIKATKISSCIKILHNVTNSMNCQDIQDEMSSVWDVHDK